MDKYEFNIKIEQLKKLVNRGDYKTALEIVDTIDWHRVRTPSLLSMAADVYEKNGEYQQAKDVLLLAFEQAPNGKRLLYKLADLALKEGSIAEAEAYYREFCDLAPDDSRQYLLRYQILKAKNAPTEQLIRTLEAYTSLEVDEKWLYELAELYHEAGRQDECVATCDQIMLMFGLGQYVDAAMELKLEYQPLSSYQMDLVENRDKYEARLKAVEEEYQEESDYPDEMGEIEDVSFDVETAEALRMQEDAQAAKLAEEMSRITGEEPDQPAVVEEESPLEKTKTLDNLYMIRDIVPSQSAAMRETPGASVSGEVPESIVEETDYGVNAVADITAAQDFTPEAGGNPPVYTDAGISADSGEAYVGKFVDKIEEEKARLEAEEQKKADEAREIERQRAAIRAARAREEEEARATRRVENEQAAALREEEERRAARQAQIDRERAANRKVRTVTLSDEAYYELDPYDAGASSNNLMIEADTPDEGFEIAVEMLRDIHRELGTKNPVAKTTSEKLNNRGITRSAAKLAGTDLVIQDAAGLTDALQNELDELMEKDRSGMIVVLIDTKDRLEELYERNTALTGKFRYVPLSQSVKDRIKTEAQVEEALAKETAAQEKELRDVIKGAEVSASGEAAKTAASVGTKASKAEYAYDTEKSAKKAGARTSTVAVMAEELEPLEEPSASAARPKAEQPPKTAPQDDSDDDTEMDIDEFAQYACKYASEIDCSITGKSLLALYERIEMMEEDGVKLTKDTAVDLIEGAADKAEKPSLGKRITGLFSAKYNKEGLLILHENDFFD